MSEPTGDSAATAVAQSAAPAQQAEVKPQGLALSDLIVGYGQDSGQIYVCLEPHLGSDAEGQVRAAFGLPGPKTVSDYDDAVLGIGKKRGKGNEWKAAEALIRNQFVDLTGVRAEDHAAIIAKYGSWKSALVADVGLRPMAKALASLYVSRIRMQGNADDE